MRTIARIVEGDPGKVICKEAERVKPAAVILGTRGRGFIQRSLSLSLGLSTSSHLFQLFHSKVPLSLSQTQITYSNLFWDFCSVLQGSVSEYCMHNCKSAPVVIVPGKGITSHLIYDWNLELHWI